MAQIFDRITNAIRQLRVFDNTAFERQQMNQMIVNGFFFRTKEKRLLPHGIVLVSTVQTSFLQLQFCIFGQELLSQEISDPSQFLVQDASEHFGFSCAFVGVTKSSMFQGNGFLISDQHLEGWKFHRGKREHLFFRLLRNEEDLFVFKSDEINLVVRHRLDVDAQEYQPIELQPGQVLKEYLTPENDFYRAIVNQNTNEIVIFLEYLNYNDFKYIRYINRTDPNSHIYQCQYFFPNGDYWEGGSYMAHPHGRGVYTFASTQQEEIRVYEKGKLISQQQKQQKYKSYIAFCRKMKVFENTEYQVKILDNEIFVYFTDQFGFKQGIGIHSITDKLRRTIITLKIYSDNKLLFEFDISNRQFGELLIVDKNQQVFRYFGVINKTIPDLVGVFFSDDGEKSVQQFENGKFLRGFLSNQQKKLFNIKDIYNTKSTNSQHIKHQNISAPSYFSQILVWDENDFLRIEGQNFNYFGQGDTFGRKNGQGATIFKNCSSTEKRLEYGQYIDNQLVMTYQIRLWNDQLVNFTSIDNNGSDIIYGGVIIFNNGDNWSGNLTQNGAPHGQGIFIYGNGNREQRKYDQGVLVEKLPQEPVLFMNNQQFYLIREADDLFEGGSVVYDCENENQLIIIQVSSKNSLIEHFLKELNTTIQSKYLNQQYELMRVIDYILIKEKEVFLCSFIFHNYLTLETYLTEQLYWTLPEAELVYMFRDLALALLVYPKILDQKQPYILPSRPTKVSQIHTNQVATYLIDNQLNKRKFVFSFFPLASDDSFLLDTLSRFIRDDQRQKFLKLADIEAAQMLFALGFTSDTGEKY